ncbi:MAG: hypothetical protein ACI4C0_08475 [Lachnospiraceae bacterium]
MQEINVEQIMQDIRKEVSEKGLKASDLRFADVSVAGEGLDLPTEYDPESMKKQITYLNAVWETASAIETRSTNKVKLFVKKIINKMVMIVMWPNIVAQDVFNLAVVNTFNQMKLMTEEFEKLQKDHEDLKKKYEELLKETGKDA